jgi:hypothetical protein
VVFDDIFIKFSDENNTVSKVSASCLGGRSADSKLLWSWFGTHLASCTWLLSLLLLSISDPDTVKVRYDDFDMYSLPFIFKLLSLLFFVIFDYLKYLF